MKNNSSLIKKCRKIIKCDSARISRPLKTMYLIIGFKRNTKDDHTSQYLKNGEPFDFEYMEERVIAHGNTEEELLASVKEYKRLCGITWEEYFKEIQK